MKASLRTKVLLWLGIWLASAPTLVRGEEWDPGMLDKPRSRVKLEQEAEAAKKEAAAAKAAAAKAETERKKAEAAAARADAVRAKEALETQAKLQREAEKQRAQIDAAKAEAEMAKRELEALKRQQTALATGALANVRLPVAGSGESFRDAFKDGSGSGPELVVIPASEKPFKMGSDYYDERPQHAVTIGRSFALGKYEVTQGEWMSVMGDNPSFLNSCGDSCPVDRVSWNDVQAFIKKLSEKTGQQYRLPSESEWEYACRVGGTEKYCGSNDWEAVSWSEWNSDNKTHPVGQKAKNAWGLYDMSGNVREWVEDCYIDNYRDGPKDEKARGDHTDTECKRVSRGGSRYYNPGFLDSTTRCSNSPSYWSDDVGFRLARTLP